jgi:hypothetical protein
MEVIEEQRQLWCTRIEVSECVEWRLRAAVRRTDVVYDRHRTA